MKKVICIFQFLLLGTQMLISQDYFPLPETNTFWISSFWDIPDYCPCAGTCSIDQYSITGDTLINEVVYHKLDYTGIYYGDNCEENYFNDGYQGAFRNDIGNKKVWFVPSGDLNESLLYEFDLEIGDTLSPGILNPIEFGDFWVEDIDTIEVGDSYRKMFLIRSGFNIYGGPFEIIEGIGGQSLVSPMESWFNFEAGYLLYCVNINDSIFYPYGANCEQIVGTESILKNVTFEIYPNPSKDILFIDNASGSHVQLFSITGLLISESEIKTDYFELKLKDVPEGMYFLRFKKDLEIQAKKIIVQR
jgi:hypothetical protein